MTLSGRAVGHEYWGGGRIPTFLVFRILMMSEISLRTWYALLKY